jgi:hypothetical protein|tara:strand:- start:50 stop:511 length:462 start_codon:yes stop_codon:yes gene_type:complete
MKEGIAEALTRISKIKSRKEQVEKLRSGHSIPMEILVDCCFNPNIKFLLPPGKPPYKPLPKESDAQSYVYSQIRRMGIFHNKGNYPDMNQLKRERQFIDFIEACDPDDAELIVSIKDKKMPYKGITAKLFEEAWPALASTWVLPKEVTIKSNG